MTAAAAGRGGENNNSVAATNGNTLGNRINSAVDAASLHQRSINSPAGLRNNLSPGLRSNLSPGLRSNLSPGLRSNLSPAMRTNMSPATHHMRQAGMQNAGGVRSARASPSLSRSTPRVSPATVTLSSGESSPVGSRPTSPQPFVPINSLPVNSLPNSRYVEIIVCSEYLIIKQNYVVISHRYLIVFNGEMFMDNTIAKYLGHL